MSRGVLILGATSTIAREVAKCYAKKGDSLYLAGRDATELERLASDLKIRYSASVKYGTFDAEKLNEHREFIAKVAQELPNFEGVVLAFGDLGDQKVEEQNSFELEKVIAKNYTGACSLLNHCANDLCQKGKGFIIGISSVAGDRGRQSNYHYGAAKGAFSLYLQGLRNRLYPHGVHVTTVKPGFVDTPMTYGKPGLFLVASPQYVAEKIVKSESKDIVYIPWFWRYIMWIIRSIPEFIFKRLKL